MGIVAKMNYDDLRPIDKIQLDVMESFRNTLITPDEALNVLLSISLSIAQELRENKLKEINRLSTSLKLNRISDEHLITEIDYILNRLNEIKNLQQGDINENFN
jgi:hypothetical protein